MIDLDNFVPAAQYKDRFSVSVLLRSKWSHTNGL